MPDLTVRSNVARDVLQTADEFGSPPKMIVEYVSNSLDNPQDLTQPVTVRVAHRRYGLRKEVTISDDACGMDAAGLKRFFVMHSENAQRQRGRRARGRFGTGKAAAFGVGTSLHIDTIRNGRRWMVELTLDELRAAAVADRPPLPATLRDGEPTDRANGTTITVGGISKGVKPQSIANELRRRLGRQLENHNVYVENRRVRVVEPQPEQSWNFSSADNRAAAEVLGTDLVCAVHAVTAGRAVDEPLRGITVTSNEVPVAQYPAAGDLASRIWGLVEVPALDEDTSTPGPFTDKRDLTLNVDNALAAATISWVQHCLEEVARALQEQDRDRRRRARTAELQRAASQAEAVLNEHYRSEFRSMAGAGKGGGTTTATGTSAAGTRPADDGESVIPDDRGTAGYQPQPAHRGTDPDLGDGEQTGQDDQQRGPSEGAALGRPLPRPRDPLGEGRGQPVTQLQQQRQRRSRGGFHIEYGHNGEDAPRAAYYASALTIEINLDHPLLAAVASDRDLFQGLAFTIAAEEYAQATANELLSESTLEDAYEALQYTRSTMDRLSRAFANADVFGANAEPNTAAAAGQ